MVGSRLFLLAVLFISIVAPVGGQTEGRPRRVAPPEDDSIRLRSDLVTLTVSVSDGSGRPVGGLGPDDFRISEDGKPQRIEHFEPIGDPYSLLLVFDISGSTEAEVSRMQAAAREFVGGLGPSDKLGMLSFARAINIHGAMTSDRRDLERQLREIAPQKSRRLDRYDESTGTSFYDALLLAATESPLSMDRSSGRRAIIVFSDCVDSTSGYEFDSVASEVERSGASIYVLLFDTRPFSDRLLTQPDGEANRINFSRTQLDRFYDELAPDSPDRGRDPASYTNLERLEINGALYEIAERQAEQIATRTGGRVYPVKSIGQLGAAYSAIAAELKTRYSIGFYPTNTRTDGTWRKLRVDVPRRPNAVVVSREGYWAPTE